VPASAVEALADACDEVAASWPSFDVDVAAGGGRVQRREGMAWLWVRRNARGVIELAEDLDRAVRRATSLIADPRRAPSAHLTIARRADRPLLDALRDESHGPLRADWLADRVDLMRSHLGRKGARYEVLHEAPLSASRRA
jgi:2'-5' RNA ligase